MPHLPSREKLFDTACLLAGRTGRIFGIRLERPVFIVGTGRCGTTLLVRILNSHAGLSGFPGEANELWHPKLEPFEFAAVDIPPIEIHPQRFTEVSIANWPPEHAETIRDVFSGFHWMTGLRKVFFTKSAMISFMIPTLLEIFSDARIIHIYRFGPSVVESYFKKNFGKYSRYTYSERDYKLYCARYWNACILEIEKRKRELVGTGGRFLEFSYEALCQNSRPVLHDVAQFLGVGPDGFRFDASKITSQNYKIDGHELDRESANLLRTMSPGMRLMGYIS